MTVARRLFRVLGFFAIFVASSLFARAGSTLPSWAYGTGADSRAAADLPGGKPALTVLIKSDAPLHLPGSTLTFTAAQTRDPYAPADWYPNEHPPMPELVAHGRKADGIIACALCHHPDGYGRPENADIRGLPADYIVRQLEAFKNGERISADPQKSNTRVMIAAAKGLTHDEMVEVAAYYASMPATQTYERVVESASAPKVWSDSTGAVFALAAPNDGTEPLSHRIIEVPEDTIQAQVYVNPHETYIAYVPEGSIARGEALATTGDGKTIACITCHGNDLNGSGTAPPLAGRSPSYIARQLADIQNGTRTNAQAMNAVVADLTPDDIIDIVAYIGSLSPH
jgi:cytochrome c553